MYSPFLRPDDRYYPEILTDAAVHVLGGRGFDRFSVRALARWMKVSPAAVLNEFTRARVLEVINICFCRRWLAWSGSEPIFGPHPASVPLRLPEGPDELLGVRVLTALQLLAEGERVRGNPVPGYQLDRLRDEELALLRHRLGSALRCCGGRWDDHQVIAVMALTRGLRLGLAEAEPRLTRDEASDVLRGFVSSATRHAVGCGDRQVASPVPDGPTTDPGRRPPRGQLW
jgi:hypothetical protein